MKGWPLEKSEAQLESWETLAEQSHYNAANFAKLCRLSLRQLQRKFRRYFGLSPQVWLDERRIVVAGNLLLAGKPVKAVAFDLGFKQPSHFCRKFKARTKLTPSQFVSLGKFRKFLPRRSRIIDVAQG